MTAHDKALTVAGSTVLGFCLVAGGVATVAKDLSVVESGGLKFTQSAELPTQKAQTESTTDAPPQVTLPRVVSPDTAVPGSGIRGEGTSGHNLRVDVEPPSRAGGGSGERQHPEPRVEQAPSPQSQPPALPSQPAAPLDPVPASPPVTVPDAPLTQAAPEPTIAPEPVPQATVEQTLREECERRTGSTDHTGHDHTKPTTVAPAPVTEVTPTPTPVSDPGPSTGDAGDGNGHDGRRGGRH
ncbi:MAG: hypothetical protein JWP30_142 [Homoserinimonas sp.]|jgi:hypothetical protein|nr:hypothetical protein [Homoserinimonas sp.]